MFPLRFHQLRLNLPLKLFQADIDLRLHRLGAKVVNGAEEEIDIVHREFRLALATRCTYPTAVALLPQGCDAVPSWE